MSKKFESWLAQYLGAEEPEVRSLMQDRVAIEFLISWSIFESDCFKGYCKVDDLEQFSVRVASSAQYKENEILEDVNYFHQRYQDKAKLNNLLHGKKYKFIDEILSKSIKELKEKEKVLLLALVVYRYRNNIFHGNKGVSSWLSYKDQIKKCCQIMHRFIGFSKVELKSKQADAA